MKSSLAGIFLGLLLWTSCRSDRKDVRQKDQQVPEVRTPEVTAEDPRAPRLPFQTVVDEQTGRTKLMPAEDVRDLTAQQIVEAANIKYPQVRLVLIKVDRPIAYVKIEDSNYLTQQMGSAGAESYLAEVTFSLTSLKGITSVNFEFPEGDHASPGTYTRENFSDLQ